MSLRQNHREALWAGLFLAVALAVPNAGVLFDGRSLVFTDQYNHLDPRPGPENYGADFVPHSEWQVRGLLPWANQHDPGGTWWQWEPAAVFTHRTLLAGQIPWWDPYVGAGVPAATNPTGTSFFPPYLVFLLLFGTGPVAGTAYALIVWFGAGLCTHLFLRRHRLSFAGSMVGALAFCFAAAMAQNVGSMLGQTLACLPLLLLVTAWLLDRPSGPRIAAAALTYGGVALSSFAPLLVAIFAATAAYALARWLLGPVPPPPFKRRHQALGFAVSGLTAVLLASFYLVPVALLVASSPTADAYRKAYTEVVSPANLLQLTSPTLLGASKVQADPWLRTENSALEVPYVGFVCLLLAALAAHQRIGEKKQLLLWAAGSVLLVAMKLVGAQPLQALASLPGLRYIHYTPYFSFLLAFPLCVLAALGFDGLQAGELSRRRTAIATVAAIFAWLLIRRVAESRGLSEAVSSRWTREWLVAGGVLLVACAAVLLAQRAKAPQRVRVLVLSLAVLAFAVESYRNTAYPRQKRWGIWNNPPKIVRALKRSAAGQRVLELGAFEPNSGSAFEIFQISSQMAFNSLRIQQLYRQATGTTHWLFLREARRIPSAGFLARANVATILLNRNVPELAEALEARRLRKVFEDPWFAIYKQPALPRYFFSSDYRVVTATEALERTIASRPSKRLMLETAPTVESRPNRPQQPEVTTERFAINDFVLSVDAPRPGLVYMSESDMPGWSATVNGQPRAILPANYAFRAVEVGRGLNRIEMRYRPPGLIPGAGLSTLGILLLAWLWLLPRRSAVEPQPSP